MAWYAILADTMRTGRTQTLYVNAPNEQAAVQDDPGASLLGGPYPSEAAAEKAYPPGSGGSTKPPPGEGPPTQNDQPTLSLPGFLRDLTSRGLWIRVAEVALGGGLILIGIIALARKPAAEAAKIAGKVAK